MFSDDSGQYKSDNGVESELDDDKHNKLIENVLNISKKPKLKKPSRTEPTLQISEFNLVKSSTGKKGNVQLKDLTKSLKKIGKHNKLGQHVEAVERKSKTLSKPLEKPQAERIRRTIAYKETKKQLNRWDAVVTSNRSASTLRFPLNDDEHKVNFDTKPEDCFKWGKTKLQLALEKVITPTKVETIEINTDEHEFPLTMEEMMEKRKETAKFRAFQSYKEAKARRQNKIKSKKYHKIERKAKAQQQLNEFEDLQKTNPEAALEKLEELEKARAQERVSLRHKSTGQWAKNKQIRAKYDKESRQVLAEQLAISRDLTRKLKKTDNESESDEGVRKQDPSSISNDTDNPWTCNINIKPSQEVTSFITSYKAFSDNHNQLDKQNKKISNSNKDALNGDEFIVLPSEYELGKKSLSEGIILKDEEALENLVTSEKEKISGESLENKKKIKKRQKNKNKISNCTVPDCKRYEDISINASHIKVSSKDTNSNKLDKSNLVEKINKNKDNGIDATTTDLGDENRKLTSKIKTNSKPHVYLEYSCGSTWLVGISSQDLAPPGLVGDEFDRDFEVVRDTDQKLSVPWKITINNDPKLQLSQNRKKFHEGIPGNDAVDDIFSGLDKKLRSKVQEKVDKLKKNNDKMVCRNPPKNTGSKLKKRKSNFEMLELKGERMLVKSQGGLLEGNDVDDEDQIVDLKRLEDILDKAQAVKKSAGIDPNKFINMKSVKLNTELPDMLVNEGDDNDCSDEEDLLRNNQRDVISEAFYDDDIVEDFHRNKQKEINENTPKDVDLTIPGWGTWGGKNLEVPKWKRRRFILKAPKPEVRKDSNRGNLIINEDANIAKSAKHMVSDVPFPYKDVKEYEISLKTPIDGTFIPQTAFRKFIEPPVITKMGSIIEPMTENVLLKKKKSF